MVSILESITMIDANGSFTYSKFEHIKFELGFDVSVYPNPITESIHFQSSDWPKIKSLQIVNLQCKTVYRSDDMPSSDIDAKAFGPGLYFVALILNDGIKATRKIVVGQ
jgi:hypothetical protein